MLSLNHVLSAKEALTGLIHYTPLQYSTTFSSLSDNQVYLKLENMQKTGSFKIRGALHKMSHLNDEEKKQGVIAASAGNHAQGVAYAAQLAGVPCTIVMPEGAPLAKIEATQGYGATIVLHGENYDDAYSKAQEIQIQTGMTFIHAFDDEAVIAGQGTIGLELLEQLPDVDAVVVPIGGGGLIAGVATVVKSIKPEVMIIGVEAAGAASMMESWKQGSVVTLKHSMTIADGINVKKPGEIPFAMTKQYVDHIITVEEEEIARVMVMAVERNKLVMEAAGATGLAAALYHKLPFSGKKVAVVITGGNVDVTFLTRIIEHGLVASGRYLRLMTTVPDKPGVLQRLSTIFAEEHSNVLQIHHNRLGSGIHLGEAEVELSLETRDHGHIQRILSRLTEAGFCYTIR